MLNKKEGRRIKKGVLGKGIQYFNLSSSPGLMCLFVYVSVQDVAKQNPPTSSVTKKDSETQIMTWFDGARDRGEHSRKKQVKVYHITNLDKSRAFSSVLLGLFEVLSHVLLMLRANYVNVFYCYCSLHYQISFNFLIRRSTRILVECLCLMSYSLIVASSSCYLKHSKTCLVC